MAVKIEKILLTTDLSEPSWSALPAAELLAERLGAELHVCSVVEEPFDLFERAGEEGMRRIFEESEARVRMTIAHTMEEKAPDLAVEIHVLRGGQPAEEIIDFAGEVGADLIVLATHGRSGVGDWILGSTAERIVRKARSPVLTVRATNGDPWP